MKLLKHYVSKDKKYYKYEVILPIEAVEEAGFKEGDELIANVKKGSINLSVKKK